MRGNEEKRTKSSEMGGAKTETHPPIEPVAPKGMNSFQPPDGAKSYPPGL